MYLSVIYHLELQIQLKKEVQGHRINPCYLKKWKTVHLLEWPNPHTLTTSWEGNNGLEGAEMAASGRWLCGYLGPNLNGLNTQNYTVTCTLYSQLPKSGNNQDALQWWHTHRKADSTLRRNELRQQRRGESCATGQQRRGESCVGGANLKRHASKTPAAPNSERGKLPREQKDSSEGMRH